jgi:hypothetical protein
MRQQISHNLKRRSQAIQNAVKKYNSLAVRLTPPKPTVDWERITHYEFLQDFTLLYNTRPEVMNKRWADNAIRFAMKQHLKVARAEEEIIRCEVEARRLHTYIHDQALFFEDLITSKADSEPAPVVHALTQYANHRRRLNEHVMRDLSKLFAHPRYAGDRNPGVREGCTPAPASSLRSDVTLPVPIEGLGGHDGLETEEDRVGLDEHDEANICEMDNIVEFIARLSLA